MRTFAPTFVIVLVAAASTVQGQALDPFISVAESASDPAQYDWASESDVFDSAFCDCCCCPSWTARVDYVYMWRESTGSDFPLVQEGGNPVFFASQFDFDGESGIDAALVYDNGCGQGLEFRWLWVDHTVNQVLPNPGNDRFFMATNPPTIIGLFGPWNIQYESERKCPENC